LDFSRFSSRIASEARSSRTKSLSAAWATPAPRAEASRARPKTVVRTKPFMALFLRMLLAGDPSPSRRIVSACSAAMGGENRSARPG
jgi:hypothetical protein